jgi:hypothetical protein
MVFTKIALCYSDPTKRTIWTVHGSVQEKKNWIGIKVRCTCFVVMNHLYRKTKPYFFEPNWFYVYLVAIVNRKWRRLEKTKNWTKSNIITVLKNKIQVKPHRKEPNCDWLFTNCTEFNIVGHNSVLSDAIRFNNLVRRTVLLTVNTKTY